VLVALTSTVPPSDNPHTHPRHLLSPSSPSSQFVGAVQKFINDRENDWTRVFIFITGFDADRATMKLDVWLGATNPYQEWNALYSSRSRVLLYVHITTYAITTTAHQSNISLTVHWPLTSHRLLTGHSQLHPCIHRGGGASHSPPGPAALRIGRRRK